ncbi:tubulin polyglutamylase TTLL6 [Alca torda]
MAVSKGSPRGRCLPGESPAGPQKVSHFPGRSEICRKYLPAGNMSKDNVCMHLTNYSINKNRVNSAREKDTGSKSSPAEFLEPDEWPAEGDRLH